MFKGRTETGETDFEEKQSAIYSRCVLGSWEGRGRGLYPVMLRNGIFAAMSINEDATVASKCSHHGCELVSPEEAQKGKNACNLASVRLQSRCLE